MLGTESTKMSEVCPCDDDREEMEVNRNHYNSLKRTKIEVETSCWPSAHSERCACTMDILHGTYGTSYLFVNKWVLQPIFRQLCLLWMCGMK